ncbi:hypothetical protein [Actinopolyspora erythraea]|uniref:hypothetical protein n=1 Tax=Actinopolyspora erythraea TaxID=414996 RepID=UPI001186AFEF|nr:hypothetical protein [Actinopolyspora erythraea]
MTFDEEGTMLLIEYSGDYTLVGLRFETSSHGVYEIPLYKEGVEDLVEMLVGWLEYNEEKLGSSIRSLIEGEK